MFFFFIANPKIKAQQNEGQRKELESLYSELDSILSNEEISLDLFLLADSLMNFEMIKKSTLSVRMSYISQITSAGRTFGVDQFGFSPGISYYHKTGLMANASGYWNSETDPYYSMTVLTAGYTNNILKKLGYFITHDFYLYNDTLDYHSFNKGTSVSLFSGFKYFDFNIDYSFLYGEKTAHRIYGNINGVLIRKNIRWIDKISILPSVGFTLGNGEIVNVRLEETVQRGDLNEFLILLKSDEYPKLTRETYLKLFYLAKQERYKAIGYVLIKDEGFTREQVEEITNLIRTEEEIESSFGLMNVSFSLPISIKTKKLNWLVNYTYNIPIELPGEKIVIENNGYLSLSLSYNF